MSVERKALIAAAVMIALPIISLRVGTPDHIQWIALGVVELFGLIYTAALMDVFE